MMIGDTLYLRALEKGLQDNLTDNGGTPFSYETRRGRVEVKKYISVPADLLDDQDRLLDLCRHALAKL